MGSGHNDCYAEKRGRTNTKTPERIATIEHSIDPFEFFNWEIAEGKKDTVGAIRKVKHDIEKSEEKETEKSREILQKNIGNSREEEYILEQVLEGSSELGSRELEEEQNGK